MNRKRPSTQPWQIYCQDVAKLALKNFGLTLEDLADERQLRAGFEDGEAPHELIERLGVKYDLVRLNHTYW